MKKLLLVDAYAIIYRAFYAFIRNPRVNSKGLNTSAIYGFVNTLDDVIKRENPTHIAVAFDPSGKTFRHEEYEQYKAQRESTPEDIKLAVPYIKKIISAYNIPILEVPGYEADDVIGTVAKIAEKENYLVYMLTPDKDFGQLVSENIKMYRPRQNGGYEIMGPREVCEKFDIDNHTQVIDLLGLMGDASDNIPGCPGVGEKTAAKLLRDFGSIDNLLANTDKLKGAQKTKVEENKEQILFSRYLATIKVDVPSEFNIEDYAAKPINEPELKALFDELEFRTMSQNKFGKVFSSLPPDEQVNRIALSKPKAQPMQTSLFDVVDEPEKPVSKKPESQPQKTEMPAQEHSPSNGLLTLKDIPHNYILVDTRVKRADLISKLFMQKSVCFDTETTGIDVFKADLVGMSFCFKEGEAYYVTLPSERDEAMNVMREFKAFFQMPLIEKIGQNMKFDMLMLFMYGIELKGKLFDTMIAHYLLQPELRHGMDYLAEIYLKYRTIHFEEVVGEKGKNQIDIRFADPDLLCNYAAEDADVTFRLKHILEKELQAAGLTKLFEEVEMPLLKVLAKMELEGVRIDTEALKASSEILTADAMALENEIQEMAGVSFNVSSPAQVGEVLFERLKLDDKAKKTKTGQYSTTEEVLEKLRSKHPIVGKILDYRGLKKLLSTYIDALPQLVNPKTGKVHTSFNQTVTSTGRLSSTNPNLQNIPIRDAQGKEIRKAFIADEGSVFLSADYSQIELRIMAHLSGDKNMIEAFLEGHDIHTATAAKIYNLPFSEVTPDLRRKAKTANFGIIYGISAFGLADRLGISRTEAKTLIDDYFATYPGVKKYMDDAIASAREKGYVETILGRRRFLADINSQNSVVRGYAERNAINAPIQGSAADIIKIAMVKIQQSLEEQQLNAKMTMQVHDELNFVVPLHEAEITKKLVVYEMENAVKLTVPLIAECGIGANWLEAH